MMWSTVGQNMGKYRSYPRIVGETGGKDFIVAHASADPQALAVAIVRGGYEYQGQKCSAASRVYVPRSLWNDVRERTRAMIAERDATQPAGPSQTQLFGIVCFIGGLLALFALLPDFEDERGGGWDRQEDDEA